MKKILLTVVGFGLVYGLNAQEAADKKIQAGIIVGGAVNMQKMDTKQFTKAGAGGDFNFGFNLNYALTDNLGINTGLELDFSSTRFTATAKNSLGNDATMFYMYNTDSEILSRKQIVQGSPSVLFELNERKYSSMYLTLPIMGIFRTKFIGNLRYFGKFGLRTSFMVSNRIDDEGRDWKLNDDNEFVASSVTNERMTVSNDLLFLKSSFGVAAGAEYNITGTTCVLAELGYYYGLTPLFRSPKSDNRHLFTAANPESIPVPTSAEFSDVNFVNNAAKQSQLMLKVTVFF
jgi:hypothetical protein